jgi:hypothetical protein
MFSHGSGVRRSAAARAAFVTQAVYER